MRTIKTKLNFQKVLDKVLEIAELPESKRQEFVTTFYEYLYMRMVSEIREVDEEGADKVMEANTQGADAKKLKKVFEEISQNPKVKATVDEVTDEVIAKLVDDVAKFATEEQKQQILSAIQL
ncbi:MAG: hypothetical protein UX79_C0029G0003 [candidate division WWE3 bacterium GW2011_GWB1_47_11]|uniref:Uncharacterized protein n=1 Tax=candidate division WWE3 bacterium GW2011_GWB1_47_11 TaxID=1619117 RepID=A0A0G1UG34_UNCKA|nr:MAG: hypothetical protein UX79_C0029G0003 [candidate division WWE3 bacterium GW2011_GWB1_47_11]